MACATPIAPGAAFCHKCGAAVSGASPAGPLRGGSAAPYRRRSSRDTIPWIVAAVLTVITIASVAYAATRRNTPSVPSMANAGNSASTDPANTSAATVRAPNIDSLSPRERFIRLEARIDQMLEKGDTTRIAFFMEMALQAYTMLPPADRDIDARYHAAMLQAQIGMFDNARALADTIMTASPDNLFGYYIRATVAEFAGDSSQAKASRAAFRAHYDAELKKNRPEYAEHRPFLEQFRNGDGAK